MRLHETLLVSIAMLDSERPYSSTRVFLDHLLSLRICRALSTSAQALAFTD
jgi:hypothetical protein